MSTPRWAEQGSSFYELLIALALISTLLAAMLATVMHQQRFYLTVNDAADAAATLENLETALAAEFMPMNTGAGDIVYAGPDSLMLRVFRGVYAICSKDNTKWILRPLLNSPLITAADSGLVYSRGTKGTLADDHWKLAGIKELRDDGQICPDSTPGYFVEVNKDLEGVISEIPIGAPLRTYNHRSYWLASEGGYWYLKTDALAGSPRSVSGRLAPADSTASSVFQFRYLDEQGVETSTVADIAIIEIEADAYGDVPNRRTGQPLRKERVASIRLRNAKL